MGAAGARGAGLTEIRHFPGLARLMLIIGHRVDDQGRAEMTKLAKLEAFAFTCGFAMTGFLTFVALPLS